MSTIEKIVATIDGLQISGDRTLTLKPTDFRMGFVDTVFANLLALDSLTFAAAEKSSGQDTASVSGTVTLFGYADLTATLRFAVDDGKVVATLDAIFAGTTPVTLPLITWIKTGNITIRTSIIEDLDVVNFGFGMDILLQNGEHIPISVARQAATEWRLGIVEDTEKGVSVDDVVFLLGGRALEHFLPKALTDELKGFEINALEAVFDTERKSIAYFSAGVKVTNGWDIAPKVSLLPGLQVNLSLTETVTTASPGSANGGGDLKTETSLTAIGSVAATFEIAGVKLPITVGATIGETSSWTFGLRPGQSVQLPSFSGLLELAGGEDFFNTLPAGLKDIPKIDIDRAVVVFEPANKALTQLSFSIRTDAAWPVIEHYFEIQKLQIAFDITDLTDKDNRQVLGDLYAAFLVGKVPLMVELKKTQANPNWEITAGLAPGGMLDLTEVTVGLFEGKVTPPDDVPRITFDVLRITVVPEQQSFCFQAGSNSPWELIGGGSGTDERDTLAIQKIGLEFSRTKAGDTSTIKGQVSSTLSVAGVDLDLTASLNDTPDGGWQFSGSLGTKPIPIGQLIQDLANWFGQVELPSLLRGLKITKLGAGFNTKSKNFSFDCELQDDAAPGLVFDIKIVSTKGAAGARDYNTTFEGRASYKSDDLDLTFELDFIEASQAGQHSTTTIAKYNAVTPPTLARFLKVVSKDLGVDANLPKALNLDADLKSLTLQIDKKAPDPIKVEAAGLFELMFGQNDPWQLYLSYTNDSHFENLGGKTRADGSSGNPAYVLGVALSGALDLSKLPLVGDIPGVGDFQIDQLGFYYTDAAFTDAQKKLIFAVAELGTETPLAPNPAGAFLDQPGFSLMARFGNQKNEAENQQPNAMPLGTQTSAQSAPGTPAFDTKPADPRKPISWLSVNKTLGPVEIDKIGLGYEAPPKDAAGELGVVGLYVDGAFSVAGLSMVLDRLGISFPIPWKSIKNPLSQVGFHLGGMFLEFKSPGFEIAGGFVNLPGGSVNMVGEFIAEIGSFGVEAYGGYSDSLGHPSLFIFLHLNAPLGGPPFFFVTGVSGGFGVNRGFTLPTFAELGSYPLLPSAPAIPTASGLAGKSNEEKLQAMTQSLLGIAKYFPVRDGEYWFAVGLDVTSFEMIEVSAILSVAFGVNLQFAVVGSAIMTLPVKEPEPIACVQINFLVAYSSEDSLLAVMGVITASSFIFDGLVHISGGFAFYTWLDGEHRGDFVLTVGGYNSHYNPPAQYPRVPRIELRAGIGIVNMVGQAYFALVPTAIMAGISFKATAALGPIAAWFFADVDFFLGWKPFHYEAQAGIEIGVSLTIDLGFVKAKITIHVGVMLSLWGPAFGGKAVVDLDIISFTIGFGAAPQPAPALNWEEFKGFLPSIPADKPKQAPLSRTAGMVAVADADPATTSEEKPLVNLMVKSGLVKSFPPGKEVDELNWIVDANHFDIRTHSTAPCTQVVYNGDKLAADYNYLTPGGLREQIRSPAHANQEPPFFVYQTPEDETPWFEQTYGIPPMELTDIQSIHTVTLQRLPINAPTPTKDVIVTLTTGGVPPSLWGNKPVSTTAPPASDQSVIKNTLIGLQFTPMIWFPKRTTFIPYYYLVFDTNDLFLDQATAPRINQAKFPDPSAIYTEMQNGIAFADTAAPRTAIANTLAGLGFNELVLINADRLSTQDYVADPRLTYMSSTNETNFD